MILFYRLGRKKFAEKAVWSLRQVDTTFDSCFWWTVFSCFYVCLFLWALSQHFFFLPRTWFYVSYSTGIFNARMHQAQSLRQKGIFTCALQTNTKIVSFSFKKKNQKKKKKNPSNCKCSHNRNTLTPKRSFFMLKTLVMFCQVLTIVNARHSFLTIATITSPHGNHIIVVTRIVTPLF